MSIQQLSKVLRSQSAFFALTGVHASPAREMRPRNYESTRVSDESRFDDQPAPQDDDMIRVHYLKHHPLYEFRNLEEFHVDSYRHWLHARADYWNTESYPAQISPWEMGSKWHNAFYLIFPFFAFYCIGNAYKSHLKQKNVKDNIVGVWSQESI
eukprot:403334002